jgi:uncharacterized Zn-binding protein involved in type VI secretion
MPGAGRLRDKAEVKADAHGCPGCPHNAKGPAILGSPTVLINDKPALRVTDMGIHMACCDGNIWVATKGSGTVLIDTLQAHRKDDMTTHCGGPGQLIEGSDDVIVGD